MDLAIVPWYSANDRRVRKYVPLDVKQWSLTIHAVDVIIVFIHLGRTVGCRKRVLASPLIYHAVRAESIGRGGAHGAEITVHKCPCRAR